MTAKLKVMAMPDVKVGRQGAMAENLLKDAWDFPLGFTTIPQTVRRTTAEGRG